MYIAYMPNMTMMSELLQEGTGGSRTSFVDYRICACSCIIYAHNNDRISVEYDELNAGETV